MNEIFEYKKSLDALHYSDADKRHIALSAAEAAKQAKSVTRKKPRSIARTALAAACISLVLISGVAAAGGFQDAAEVFGPIFGVTDEQTEIINKIGHPIYAGNTQDGITITADAVIGDKYNACIVYSISREDGTSILPEGVSVRQLSALFGGAEINSGFGGTHGSQGFRDNDPNDAAIQYVQYITADAPLKKGVVPVEFTGLSYYDENNTKQAISESTWKFSFDFDYEDCSVALTTDETFSQHDMTYTITEVIVSPVAVRVAYEVDSEIEWSNAHSGQMPDSDAEQMRRYFENVSIVLQKTDGTEIDMSNSGGSVAAENGKTVCTKGEILPEIIPLDELEAVIVGGVKLPINK